MNIDINQILPIIWAFLMSPAGIIIMVGAASIGGLRYLTGKQREIEYVKAILSGVHELMAGQLGDKAEAVYQAWLAGLEAISDGDFTTSEMVTELVRYIKIALNKQNVSLSSNEEAVVVQAASMTAEAMTLNTKSTKKAVTIMMAK